MLRDLQEVDGPLMDDAVTALSSTTEVANTKRHQFRYDCIFDTSLMEDIVQESSSPTGGVSYYDLDRIGSLLLEATRALQEHGIYIVITKQPMASTPVVRDMLQEFGTSFGMQWKFDLDIISHGDVHVSVARKYFTGVLPSFGKLANKETTDDIDRLAP